MDHRVIGTENIVTLDATEAFLLMGDRATQWPQVVRVLEWADGGTYVKVSGHRADRNGDPIAHQPTSECLMFGADSRLQYLPEWLTDSLSRGTSPIENTCICPDPLGGRHDSRCMIHGWAIATV